jgi:hypothetical protein
MQRYTSQITYPNQHQRKHGRETISLQTTEFTVKVPQTGYEMRSQDEIDRKYHREKIGDQISFSPKSKLLE